MTECPKCGDSFGYYTKAYASGWVNDNQLFGTNERYNSGLHDHLRYSRESKFYFCMSCDERIARVSQNEC
jgi:hypothetical protein